ncbi:hypothetical protein DFP72DRAFT_349115 [Ephemerocybe angulata]|uniref:Uncharacterized protein n=1 Tax=Ephemerocybe angulata TaxID=980116 RepID=A0A8H6HYH2_9AGAR|nr:hypothetical protein DFP72DRAFT_349115 [Tulosesus angulatus]
MTRMILSTNMQTPVSEISEVHASLTSTHPHIHTSTHPHIHTPLLPLHQPSPSPTSTGYPLLSSPNASTNPSNSRGSSKETPTPSATLYGSTRGSRQGGDRGYWSWVEGCSGARELGRRRERGKDWGECVVVLYVALSSLIRSLGLWSLMTRT